MATDTESKTAVAEYVELDARKAELEAELEKVKDRLGELAESISADWVEAGIQNMQVNGRTLYLAREFFCNKRGEIPMEAAVEAIRASGLTDLIQIGYNAARVKSWAREQIEQARAEWSERFTKGEVGSQPSPEECLPEPLRPVFQVAEVHRLRCRKA